MLQSDPPMVNAYEPGYLSTKARSPFLPFVRPIFTSIAVLFKLRRKNPYRANLEFCYFARYTVQFDSRVVAFHTAVVGKRLAGLSGVDSCGEFMSG
jgi:hypothetical protein